MAQIKLAEYTFDNSLGDCLPTFTGISTSDYTYEDTVNDNITTRIIYTTSTKTITKISFKSKTSLLTVSYLINTKYGDAMFSGCKNLISINVPNWDVAGGTSFEDMFNNCSKLEYLDLSSFTSTSLITSMATMFYSCKALTYLNLSSFDTTNLTMANAMFRDCTNLKELDLTSFDTSKITISKYMFEGWSSSQTVYISSKWTLGTDFPPTFISTFTNIIAKYKFNQTTYENFIPTFNSDFTDYNIIDEVDTDGNTIRTIGNDSGSLPTLMQFGAGSNTSQTKSLLNVYKCNTSEITNMAYMFSNCRNLTSLDLSSFNTEKVTNMNYMFYSCLYLTSLNVSSFNTQNVTGMTRMFYNCSRLTSLDLSNFNTEKVTDMSRMFYYCTGLTSLDISNFNTQKVTDMAYMFASCSKLTSLDLSSFNTQNATTATSMFDSWSSSQDVYISSKWTLGTDFPPTFIITFTNIIAKYKFNQNTYESFIPTFNEDFTDYIYNDEIDADGYTIRTIGNDSDNLPTLMRFGNTSYTSREESLLNVYEYEVSEITDMSYMFYNCRKLTSLDFSNLNAQNATDMSRMFQNCSNLTSLDLSNLNAQNVTNLVGMFYGCSKLTSLDLSNFNTQNVTDMSYMFNGCSKLTSLNLSSFNTQNVTTMARMFYTCSRLTSLNLSSFNTQNVTNMSDMFYYCSKLTSLDLSNFNTEKVTTMSNIFYLCSNLTSLNLSNFNTQNVTNMSYMFYSCSKLTSLDLSNFNTQKVANMSNMFNGCSTLTSLDLSSFNTEKVTNSTGMFTSWTSSQKVHISSEWTLGTDFPPTFIIAIALDYIIAKYKFNQTTYENFIPEFNTDFTDYLYNDEVDTDGYTIRTIGNNSGDLPTLMRFGNTDTSGSGDYTKQYSLLEVNELNTNNINSMLLMFYQCKNLTYINTNFNTNNVTNMQSMFSTCTSLTSLDVSNFNTSNVVNMNDMFNGCTSLTSLDVSNFNTSKVVDMNDMFNGCTLLTSLNVSNFNTESATTMNAMFNGCTSLTSLDVSNFNTNQVTDMTAMFNKCSSLTSLDVSNFNTGKVTNMAYMFQSCSNLTSLNVSNFNTESATTMNAMFNGCTSLTSLDVSNFNTNQVANMTYMFSGCSKLTSLDLSNFSTKKVTNISYMFANCSKLTLLDLSNFNTDIVTNTTSAFNNCTALKDIGLIYCNVSTVNKMASLVPTSVECNAYYYDADETQLVKPDNINYIKYAFPTNIQLPPHIELRSVGEVKDEIDLKTGILIKRIEVDENGRPFILEEPIEEKVILNYTNSCDYGRILPTGTYDKYNVVTGEYYQTMTTILLDGENIWSEMEEMTNTIKFTAIGESVGVEELNMLGEGGLYCDNDLFPNINDDSDVEHCRVDEEGNKFYIYISKERLMSPDLISYQIWLQQNKFNMTYELAIPQTITKSYEELDATQARWDTLDSTQDCMIYLTSTDKDDNYIITPTFEYIAPSSNNFYLDLLLPNTEYTIYVDGINEETDTINLGGITTSYTRACLMTSGDNKWVTFNSNETLNKIMIIKGNSQEENITYFKGIGNIDNPTITIVNEDETQQSIISYPDVHLRSLPTGERDYFDTVSSIITQNVGVRPFENGDLENANLITDGINTLYPLIEPITQYVEHQQLLAYNNSKIKITSDTGLITTLTYAVPLSNAYRLPILKTGTVYTLKYPSASGTMTIGDITYNITSDSMLFTTPLVINGDTSTIIFSDENPQNVILIEGEYRNREVNYFSGIKSVSNPIITIVDNTIENSERFEYKPIREIELRSLPNGVADILDIVKQKAIISVGYRSYQQGDELLSNVWTDGYNTTYALENPVFHDVEIDTPIINTNSTIYLTSDDLIPQLNYCVPSVNSFLLDLLLPNTTYTLYSESETSISYSLGGVYNSSFIGTEVIKLEDIKNNLLIFNNDVSDENIMLLKGDTTNITVPYFQGVKSVNNLDFIIEGMNNEKNTMTLQNNISLRACGNFRDSIDMTTCILTKELEEVALKGDENWFSLEEVESVNVDYMLFGCTINGVADSQNASIICNRFNHKYLSGSLHEQECVYCLDNQIRICVKKTTIGGNNIDALKTWLNQNNVSIIYALGSPISEKLTNVWEIMPPTSYDNKTLISTKLYSNTPKPIITITIATTTLEEIVSDLNAKNKQLEEESLVTMLAVTEVYEMIYGGATTMSLKDSVDSKPTVMSINEIEEEIEQTPMGKIYVKLIKAGMKTIEQVPYFLQEEVIYYLNKE